MKIVSEEKFRSEPLVNTPDNMIRVCLTMSLFEYKIFKNILRNHIDDYKLNKKKVKNVK